MTIDAPPPPAGYPSLPSMPPPPPPAPPRTPWFTALELRVALTLIVALAAVGAAAGWVWQWWSPRTIGLVVGPGAIIPDEKETFIATDGRFLIITAGIAVVATIGVWAIRRWRGPSVAAALAIGGTGGALLTDLVGHLTGGGHAGGTANTIITLTVQVHAGALLLVEPLLALILYGLLTSFAGRDDLGNEAVIAQPVPPSVQAGGDPQDLGGYGNGPGFAQ